MGVDGPAFDSFHRRSSRHHTPLPGATEIDPALGHEMDLSQLPALVVYRARELVKFAANVEELEGADDVEDWLDGD